MAADPSFRGFVETTLDALLIFEGCRRGVLPKITRRLQEFEKRALVVSGAVFVFDEEETGIKRWTDGLSWSPSRTLGNFLVYRELDKKANAAGGPDEGNNSLTDNLERAELSMGAAVAAAARAAAGAGDDEDQVDDDEKPDVVPPVASTSKAPAPSTARRRSLSDTTGNTPPLDRARERALVGSLTSTYRFRSDGLVKKTISLSGLHMIGYYCIDDVTSGRLRTPSSHSELISLEVSSDFLSPTLFRVPPIVEIGADGQLKYKGESDTPMSPMTRSGSSQGFTTPALTQVSFAQLRARRKISARADRTMPNPFYSNDPDHRRPSRCKAAPRRLACNLSQRAPLLNATTRLPTLPIAAALEAIVHQIVSTLTPLVAHPRTCPPTTKLQTTHSPIHHGNIRRTATRFRTSRAPTSTQRIAVATDHPVSHLPWACSARRRRRSNSGVTLELRNTNRFNSVDNRRTSSRLPPSTNLVTPSLSTPTLHLQLAATRTLPSSPTNPLHRTPLRIGRSLSLQRDDTPRLLPTRRTVPPLPNFPHQVPPIT